MLGAVDSTGREIITCVTQYFPELQGMSLQIKGLGMIISSVFSIVTLKSKRQWSNDLKVP